MRAEERILGGLDAGYRQFPWAAIVTVTGTYITLYREYQQT